MRKTTCKHLFECGQTGRYAVGELKVDHVQEGCPVAEQTTRFQVRGTRGDEVVALFPHDTWPLEERVFTDGHIRIIKKRDFKVVGRIGH